MPGLRRQGRVLALQLLYQVEISGEDGAEAIERFWGTAEASKRGRDFAMALYRSAREHREAIDERIVAALEHWKLHRLAVPVRCVLRLAVAEMLYLGETAPAVVIDEAVSLARDFADDEAAKFVNGVLDQVRRLAGLAGPPLAPPPAAG